jgi:signal transduction histidine kinase
MAGLFAEIKHSATFRDPTAAGMLSMFDQALQQILSTIEGLTEVVQQQRRLELTPVEAVELLPFVQEVIRNLKLTEDQQQSIFTFDFSAAPSIRMARPGLQSILYNLLSNALKYAAPGRPLRVRVSAKMLNKVLVLSVQDNGRGIDLERYGDQLFQLFRRFHPEVDGLGMGLYLVNRLVHQAGGKIEVTSVEGEGTTFHLHLPQ